MYMHEAMNSFHGTCMICVLADRSMRINAMNEQLSMYMTLCVCQANIQLGEQNCLGSELCDLSLTMWQFGYPL